MDVVEFAESILGFELLDYYKDFLRACYKYISDNNKLYYIPPRGNGHMNLTILQSIAIMYHSKEYELIKEEKDEKIRN